jgi:hypothetical protein
LERLYAVLATMEIVAVERELPLRAAHVKAAYAIAYAVAFAAAPAQHRAKLVASPPKLMLLEGAVNIDRLLPSMSHSATFLRASWLQSLLPADGHSR